MEERRKHPQECLRQEEWGEIKAFVQNTVEYRKSLCSKLDAIRSENKERFDQIMAQLKNHKEDGDDDHSENEERIRRLENFRWTVAGAVAIITVVLIPVALAVIK